jgi:hypothetical protein
MYSDLSKKLWWNYIEVDLQGLLLTSQMLAKDAEGWSRNIHDYSFIVFPAAKAFEGFLKKFFLDLGFITSEDYYGKRFRIGKALNPNLEAYFRGKEGVYDRLVNYCHDTKLANQLWETWIKSRNLVFHWFPNEKNALDLNEAKERVEIILDAIDSAFKENKITNSSK